MCDRGVVVFLPGAVTQWRCAVTDESTDEVCRAGLLIDTGHGDD